ncbi:MAG: glycoside hydrolase family 3 N-terminal domain-containing protein [Pedobacter sp.]|uniref:glycoside hydrolase family 3 N-terminal domain-containing protein n=1 Tax=Pedobacter sp. TaxID=1411316 RepID=UPI003398AF55
MIKKYILIVALSTASLKGSAQLYKNSKAPVATRVKDLMARMTLEEKVGQMNMSSLKESLQSNIGYGVLESPFITAKDIAFESAEAKKHAFEKTRLGIPPIQIGEGLHGVLAAGSTIFPQTIGQGSTWNPELIYQMGGIIAEEATTMGIDQALSPLFDLIRDPRYGRVEECFAEDPYLVSKMGYAFVTGLQGMPSQTKSAIAPNKIMATAKHFAGYSYGLGGVNLAPTPIGERELRTMFLAPFEEIVRKGNIYSLMPSYNEIDGIPAHSSTFLLDQVLRREWKFSGYVISDYGALAQLYNFHQVAKGPHEAAVLGLNAGVDVEASRPDVYKDLAKMLRAGTINIKQIDAAVKRILTAKFKAGLFEKGLADSAGINNKLHTATSVALSRKIAEESIVLLKNQNNLLPLDVKKLKSIAVIGPNSDKVQYGDYSYTRDNRSGTTVLQGIRQFVGEDIKVNYAQGCELSGHDRSGIEKAVAAAQESDIAVVVLGTTSVVFQGIGWNGKAGKDEPTDPFTCGEGYDVTDIDPQGVQRELLQAIYKTGKPVILVLIQGRPWSIAWEKENIPAIIEGWYPGEKGGNAMADIIFGKVNPSGRLNMSIPQSSGHIPVFYNYVNSSKGNNREPGTPDKPGRDYVYSSTAPLFPFGYGLSYTDFIYSDLKFSAKSFGKAGQVEVSCKIKNTGSIKGKEVVQLYVGEKVNSVSTPVKSLRGFTKIELLPGEEKTVRFKIAEQDIQIWNRQMKRVTEPGTFKVMIGKASDNIILSDTIEFTGNP